MKIRFMTPPKALQIGGVENAVEGLREALLAEGVAIEDGPDLESENVVHHFHGLWNLSHSRLARQLRREGKAYVVSPHGMLEPWAFHNKRWKKIPYFKCIEQHMLKGAGALWVTSAMEKEHLSRVIEHPHVDVLPLGCRDRQNPSYDSARQAMGWRKDDKIMLFLSRVDPKKGLHMLLDAMVALQDKLQGWKLVVVGDGPDDYHASLIQQVERLKIQQPQIDWVGPVWGEARWDYLRGADLFCLPTHSENFGIAVLESMHVGTPVLTTTGTPWRDFSGMPGVFICDPDVESIRDCLACAVRSIQHDWSSTARLNLSQWAEQNFSWSQLVSGYIEAYQAVLKRGNGVGF